MTDPRYPYVAVDVAEVDADEAAAALFDLGALGVEHRDATTLARGAGDRVTLVASFQDEEGARAAVGGLPQAWSPRFEEVVGDAWRDEWKKHFEPFRLCEGIVVRPPWRDYEAEPGTQVIVLEPGRAFGTGLHETTSLAAEVLSEYAAGYAGGEALDVGCGSGILSLVAIGLGVTRVRAIDIDVDAIAVTRENAQRNGATDRVIADETPVGAIVETYPLVVANIEAKTLVELASDLTKRVRPGGRLVLSGVLAPEVSPGQLESVRAAYAPLREEEVRRKGEWIAVVFRAGP